MSRRPFTRTLVGGLIAAITYTPMLGSYTGTLAAAQAAQNTTTSYLYDATGNPTQVTDPLGRVTKFTFDAFNRVTQQVQPIPTTGATAPTTKFTYDNQGQPSTVVDPRSLTTTYTFDGLGNQPALASPDTGTASQTYDDAGNMLTSTDARGKVTTFAYDVLNRVTSIRYASGTPTILEYDGGSAGAPNAVGHLTRMTDESGQTTYGYDQQGRLLNKIQTTVTAIGTVSRTVAYAYGGNGKLTSLTYPSGARINYSYDAGGNIGTLTLNPPDANGATDTGTSIVLLDHISYAAFGPVQAWDWGNSTEASPNHYARTFDLDGRVVSYPLGSLSNASGVLRTVTYDAASRVTSMTHAGAAGAAGYDQSFGYDDLDRLISYVNATGTQTYAYDASGNRTRVVLGATSYAYTTSTTSNRLSSTSGPSPAKTVSYDGAGNIASDGATSYSYSDRGRLSSTTKNGTTTTYLYNGLGQRASKVGIAATSGANEYVYDQQGRLLGEYSAVGDVLQETVYVGNLPVVVLKQVMRGTPPAASEAVFYIYTDHLTAPRVLTDAGTNSIVWSWVLADPFGVDQPNENPTGAGIFTYNVRLPGQLFDKESGNHYNYYRDYDPQTGRYIESDPIGLEGGINTYGYVSGNPLSYSDPSGLCPMCVLAVPYIAEAVEVSWTAYRIYRTADMIAKGLSAADEAQRDLDNKNYHNTCDKPPPPGLNDCEMAKWQYRQAMSCQSKREDWEERWGTPQSKAPHDRALANVKNRLKNAAAEIAKHCSCPAK